MKVQYRFVFDWTESRAFQLRSLGLKVVPPVAVPPGFPCLAVSHAFEGDPGWSEACSLIRDWDGMSSVTTQFTPAEVDGAAHCALAVIHASGYPQPEDDFAFRDQTYDLTRSCSACGEGAVQVRPFRVRRSLKWGRNAFLKLHWVEGVCFMLASTWKEHLSGLGIGALPVEGTKGQTLDDVIQLDLGGAVPLSMEGTDAMRCGTCGGERYPWHTRGFFPAPIGPPGAPIFRSVQGFGYGLQPANAIIVTAEVVRAIKAAGLRGVEFWPCAPR